MWAMADGPPSIKGSTSTLLNDPGGLDPAEMRQFFRIIDDQAYGDRTANFPVGRFPVGRKAPPPRYSVGMVPGRARKLHDLPAGEWARRTPRSLTPLAPRRGDVRLRLR